MSLPEIIRFEEGVKSFDYMHAARVIIDERGRTTKDKANFLPGRMATQTELSQCVTVTAEMAKIEVQRHKDFAAKVVGMVLDKPPSSSL